MFLSYCTQLCCNLSLGLVTKAKGLQECRPKRKPKSHISCSQECKRVWGNKPSHPQGNSHFGSWSLGGFLNLQKAIVGVKTHWSETLLISLENPWKVDVWNGLAWPVWTFEAQVMVKSQELTLFTCYRWRATYRWKAFDEGRVESCESELLVARPSTKNAPTMH
jgi:hypothetical protein